MVKNDQKIDKNFFLKIAISEIQKLTNAILIHSLDHRRFNAAPHSISSRASASFDIVPCIIIRLKTRFSRSIGSHILLLVISAIVPPVSYLSTHWDSSLHVGGRVGPLVREQISVDILGRFVIHVVLIFLWDHLVWRRGWSTPVVTSRLIAPCLVRWDVRVILSRTTHSNLSA
jgi:hypothetical protein